MSDMSNSNSSSSRKRRLSQIDDIEYLTQEINILNDFVYKLEFECTLMTVKIKREKVKAVSAIAKSHELLAKMEVSIAESDLCTEIERLRNRNFKNKRMKLDRNEGESQVTPAPTKTTVSVQTIETMSNKKKTRHSSSRSQVDISLDKTVIIPTIHESSASLVETTSHKSPTSLSPGLFKKMSENKSDSEVLLSSSNKAEFHELCTKTQTQETVKKPSTKKQKSEQKVESKSKSKHISKRTQSPTASPKMVDDLRKSVNTASNHMNSSSRAVSTQNSSTGEQKPTACVCCMCL